MKNKVPAYKPEVCDHCTQTTTYPITLDKGSAHIMLALKFAVERLGRNKIHLGNDTVRDIKDFNSYREMIEGGFMTYKMEGNSSRPRYFGLIASLEERGYFCITAKGYAFLQNDPVARIAIIEKARSMNIGYYTPAGETTIKQLLKSEPYWEGALKRAPIGQGDNLFAEAATV